MRTSSESPDGLSAIASRLRRDVSAISRIETGEHAIPADDLPLFLTAYGLTADEFAERAEMEAA